MTKDSLQDHINELIINGEIKIKSTGIVIKLENQEIL